MPRSTSLPSRKQHDMPKCLDYEEGLLGLFMVKPDTIDNHKDLSEELWGNPLHYVLYDAMRRMRELGKPIGLLEITGFMRMEGALDQLKQGDSDGASFITAIYSRATDNDKSDFFIAEMRTKYAHRQSISLMSKCMDSLIAAKHADMQTIFDTVTDYCKQACDLCVEPNNQDWHTTACMEFVNEVEDAVKGRNRDNFIPTPFPTLNREVIGVSTGEMLVIQGRESSGKSLLADDFLEQSVFVKGEAAAKFTVEMPSRQCVRRMACKLGNISLKRLKEGRLNKDEYQRMLPTIERIQKANLHFYDSKRMKLAPDPIEAEIRRLKRTTGLSTVVIDYLQKLKFKTKKDVRHDQALGIFCADMKSLAVELDLRMILISSENNAGGVRDTGDLDYDADNFIRLMCDSNKILERAFIGKWREGMRGYYIPCELVGEYCRIQEVPEREKPF